MLLTKHHLELCLAYSRCLLNTGHWKNDVIASSSSPALRVGPATRNRAVHGAEIYGSSLNCPRCWTFHPYPSTSKELVLLLPPLCITEPSSGLRTQWALRKCPTLTELLVPINKNTVIDFSCLWLTLIETFHKPCTMPVSLHASSDWRVPVNLGSVHY